MPPTDVGVMEHATLFSPRGGWRVRCARRRAVKMNEDMRLKSLLVKGPKIGVVPCLKTCDKEKKCPCDELQKFLNGKAPSDISCLEMEWMHVPAWWGLSFWIKLVFPIVVTILLVVLVLVKTGTFFCPQTNMKASLAGNGYSVECWFDSADSFESRTNGILRIKKGLQTLKTETSK